MKLLCLVIISAFLLTGCAMSAPKEDLQNIFVLVKQRNFDGAKRKVQEESSKGLMGTFSTYSGGSLDPADQGHSQDNVTNLIEGAQYTITFCDKKISELKAIHGSNIEGDQGQDDF